jgi:hypothetical protein
MKAQRGASWLECSCPAPHCSEFHHTPHGLAREECERAEPSAADVEVAAPSVRYLAYAYVR